MTDKLRRGGLGRGLGALIPTAPADGAASGGSAEPHWRGTGRHLAPAPPLRPQPPGPPDRELVDGEPDHAGSSEESNRLDPAGQPAESAAELRPVPGVSFLDLPVESIHPNPRQPRQVFDEESLTELTHSIREFGVLQPIVVRPDGAGYQLVMGERRLRAAGLAGLPAVPAIVRSTADDAMLRDALLENIHRTALNPLEEAAAYQQLLEEFGTTHDELAQRLGRSRPQVSNTIRLLQLPVAVQRRVAAGVLSAGHARALLGLDDADRQDEVAARIVAEGLSVRATEELVTLIVRGHDPTVPRRAPARRITAPAVTELADRLSDAFDTRVRVELGRRKGKITVEFGSVDDLERIVGLMAPTLASRTVAPDQPSEP